MQLHIINNSVTGWKIIVELARNIETGLRQVGIVGKVS